MSGHCPVPSGRKHLGSKSEETPISSNRGTGAFRVPGSWFARLAWLNAVLDGFNLLPAIPMDGGRVARALLERRHDRVTATRQAARIARILAVVMIVGGIFYDFWLILIEFFVYLGASAEEQAAERERPCSARARPPTPHAPSAE